MLLINTEINKYGNIKCQYPTKTGKHLVFLYYLNIFQQFSRREANGFPCLYFIFQAL